MSISQDKLTEMFDNSRLQTAAIDDSTAQIEAQITELESQRDAVQEGVVDKSESDMTDYLENTKLSEVGGDHITFGGNYGVTNIIDWIVYDSTGLPIYEFEGIGWDDDQTIIDLEADWQFGYDYIHHDNGVTGTYGLQGQIDILYNALNLLIANKEKYGDSRNVFQKYMT